MKNNPGASVGYPIAVLHREPGNASEQGIQNRRKTPKLPAKQEPQSCGDAAGGEIGAGKHLFDIPNP